MSPFLVVSAFLVVAQDDPRTEVCSPYTLPLHGSVYRADVYGFFGKIAGGAAIYSFLAENPKTKTFIEFNSGEPDAHSRHRFFGKTLWYSFSHLQVYTIRLGDLPSSGLPLPLLREKYTKTTPGRAAAAINPAPGVAFDFVPISDNVCRVFFYEMRTKKIEAWETQWGALEKKKNERGEEIYARPVTDGIKPESFPSAFVEDFYSFIRKGDYYFLTQTGKLYIAAPPKKGEKSRTMKALWDDDKRPIVAVIEDTDNDKVWLFAKDKKPGAKLDLFFEMRDTIRTETFDPAKLRPVNIESRAKMLLEYLPLISAEKKK